MHLCSPLAKTSQTTALRTRKVLDNNQTSHSAFYQRYWMWRRGRETATPSSRTLRTIIISLLFLFLNIVSHHTVSCWQSGRARTFTTRHATKLSQLALADGPRKVHEKSSEIILPNKTTIEMSSFQFFGAVPANQPANQRQPQSVVATGSSLTSPLKSFWFLRGWLIDARLG